MARDAALGLVGRINRWLISGAVLVAAGLTALTAHAFHAKAATRSSATTPTSASQSQSPASANGNAAPISPPAGVPSPVSPATASGPPVVSGGS